MPQDPATPFSSFDAFRFGWRHVCDDIQPVLILGASSALLALLQRPAVGPHDDWRPTFPLLAQLLQACVTMLYMRWALAAHDGTPFEIGRIKELLRGFWRFLLTSFLLVLVVAVGFVFLILPGVLLALRYGFATFLSVDQGLDPLGAFRESAQLTREHRFALLGFALLSLVLNALGAMLFGLGIILTLPTTFAAAAYVLRRLQQHAATAQRPDAAPQVVAAGPA